ncbi:MAG TPA: hypothetical protein PKA20_17565 [Burkholderiaceae bacterium]|nr:hypothetical protein [Burkholderiaceae bacterium]
MTPDWLATMLRDPSAPLATADPADRLAATLDGFSLEVHARDAGEVAELEDMLAPGTDVHIASLTGQPLAPVLDACRLLKSAGMNPVPHVVARGFVSRAALESFLDSAAAQAGVEKVLLVGGDADRPAGPFASALDVLATGLLVKYDLREVGIAAYPDGHRLLSNATLIHALVDKLALGAAQGLTMQVFTQFSFEARSAVDWLARHRHEFGATPVAVGMAGPMRLANLLRYASRCGVAGTLRALTTHRDTTSRLFSEAAPDRQLAALAALRRTPPPGPLPTVHFFTFGALRHTLAWVEAVRERRVRFTADGGFDVLPR